MNCVGYPVFFLATVVFGYEVPPTASYFQQTTFKSTEADFIPACQGSLSQAERSQALRIHNDARSKIARGEFHSGRGQYMPPASNMMKLQWDCSLENSAQLWASQCDFRHSNTTGVGENLYMVVSSTPLQSKGLVVNASIAWLEEFQKYGWNNIILTKDLFYSGVGHATQMVWATTQFVGCATHSCKGGKEIIVACHYRESGNILGAEIYQFGDSCSDCPISTTCDNNTSLCT